MAVERLTKRLTGFGFTEEEAAIYVFLSATGPTPARVVARRFDYNRMRAYRALKELEEKGLAQRIMGRPVRFAASPIRDILDRYLEGLQNRLSDLSDNEETIVSEWDSLRGSDEEQAEEPRFRLHQGRQQVFDNLLQMFERSSHDISLVTTVSDLQRMSLWGMDDRLVDMRRRGRRIRVLTEITKASLLSLDEYLGRVEVRHVDLPTPVRFAIVDNSEALTTASMDDSMSMTTQRDTGMWTNASSYVAALRTFYDAVWSLATEAEPLINSLETGMPLEEIRVIRKGEEYNTLFRDMLRRGTRSIDVMIRDPLALPVSSSSLGSLAEGGARVRLLTRIPEEIVEQIAEASGSIELKDLTGESSVGLLVVDGRESLLNVPLAEGGDRSVWSNLPAYVGAMTQLFREYWSRGESIEEKVRKHREARRIPEIYGMLAAMFRKEGWSVEENGVYVGGSGMRHTFDIVAKDTEGTGKPLCLSILQGGAAFNRIIELGASISDLGSARIALASLSPYREEERKLASLYGISLIQAGDVEGIVEAIRQSSFTLM